ncbi:MAG TPA: helix-turn-helix domain-containing protein [Chloroflexia bacterium]|nr:helix-turn-helix domain-containing protein [Chloroflexia bacterium]
MGRKKKEKKLEEVAAGLLTMEEASQWINDHKEEFKQTRGISTGTLKKACYRGRLKAVLKGNTYLTREKELREYLEEFDPSNKRESRPLQPRATKRRLPGAGQPPARTPGEQILPESGIKKTLIEIPLQSG